MIKIEGTFPKIGRHRFDPPTVKLFTGRDTDDAMAKMYKFVTNHLASREVEVEYLADGTGAIFVGGGRPAGTFTWKEVTT